MNSLSFKPKQITKRILGALNDRAYDVVVSRFGLDGRDPKTLESIGNQYSITRERVRQIENAAMNSLRKSDAYAKEAGSFEELKDFIDSAGCLISADDLLNQLARDKESQNHFNFYLVLCPDFSFRSEDENFKERWTVDEDLADKIEAGLLKFHAWLSDDKILPEEDLIEHIMNHLKDLAPEYRKAAAARAWLSISKQVAANPLGEWGKNTAPHIRLKGIKDYAHLVLRRHGSPLHFTEVAKAVSETFGRKTNAATCHNELIKDKRFVIVGRGKYALSEWGYRRGVVRDVIADIIKREGPLSREEIIDRVMKERFVEKNTIIVNLQNPKYFRKNREGLFVAA